MNYVSFPVFRQPYTGEAEIKVYIWGIRDMRLRTTEFHS